MATTRTTSSPLPANLRRVIAGQHRCRPNCPASLRLLERLLARLTSKQRTLVRSVLLEGGTRRQIAARFGVCHQTVTQQLAAADLTSIRLALQLARESIS